MILLAVSIFLISNTVAIGISVRSAEINIMKYIGATDFFVRAPFVLEGMLIGLIGAAVPLGLIYSLYNYALNYVINRFMVLSGFLNFLSVDEIFHISGCRCGYRFPGKYRYCKKASARVNTIPADNPDPICHDVCGVWLCTAS